MMHAGDAESEGNNYKKYLNSLIAKLQAEFYPFQDLAIDEMVIDYKGHWKHKQFNASKPRKYKNTFGL